MSLNCLTCQRLQRTDSDREWGNNNKPHSRNMRRSCLNVDRSWSGNLSPLPCEAAVTTRDRDRDSLLLEDGAAAKFSMMKKGHHRRIHSDGTLAGGQPKLVRSSGMRRDWSFEDLHKRGENRTEQCS